MTETAIAAPTEPDGAPRLAGLDILRGVAILGILFMNVNAMGGATLMGWLDIWRYGHSRADEVAFFLRNMLADGTARCLLEMLFGVGMVILTERASRTLSASAGGGDGGPAPPRLSGDRAVAWGYCRRNIVLFLFGVVHVFVLLWPGDILHTYGIAALIAFLFRRLAPRRLLALGLSLALFQLVDGGAAYLGERADSRAVAAIEAERDAGRAITATETATLRRSADNAAARDRHLAEMRRHMAAEDAARSPGGGFADWAGSAWNTFLLIVDLGVEPFVIWEAASVMLIGAALYRWGVIQGTRSRGFYAILTLAGYGFGLSIRGAEALRQIAGAAGPTTFDATQELARIATTLGHIGVIHLLLATAFGSRLLGPFAAAGRTALTIYIVQTLVCLWIIYPPWGLALYGRQGWAAWMATAAAVDLLLLLWANWYVTRYRLAPVEWAWRSIVAGKPLPIRKAAAPLAPGRAGGGMNAWRGAGALLDLRPCFAPPSRRSPQPPRWS